MKILIVEDSEERIEKIKSWFKGDDVRVSPTARNAIGEIYDQNFGIIFLDYDFGENRPTGRLVAQYLAENHYPFRVIIHSMNPVGAREMKHTLPHAEIIPYNKLVEMVW